MLNGLWLNMPMARGGKGGLAGALIVAAGVGLVAVASRAKGQSRGSVTRAQTDAAFYAALYQVVPKATIDSIMAQWAVAQRAGMAPAQARESLIRLVVKHVPWASVVAFNRTIVPMLEAGTATIPNATPAFQLQIIEAVKAHGLNNPQMPPQYAAAAQGVGCLAAGL